METVGNILAGVLGSSIIIGVLIKFVLSVWADRISRVEAIHNEIDLDLRNRRIEGYSSLWRSTGLLPKWPPNRTIEYEDLNKLNDRLSQWYFEEGGIFLSRSAHNNNFDPLRAALAKLQLDEEVGLVSETHYEEIRELCSKLRSALSYDIQSRRDSEL